MGKPTTNLINANPAAELLEDFAITHTLEKINAIGRLCAYGEDVRVMVSQVDWNISLPRSQRTIHDVIVMQNRISPITLSTPAIAKAQRIAIFIYLVARVAEVTHDVDVTETEAYIHMLNILEGVEEPTSDYISVMEEVDIVNSYLAKQYEELE